MLGRANIWGTIRTGLVAALAALMIAVGFVPAEAVAPLGNSTFLLQTQTQNLSGINGATNNNYLAQSVTLNGVVYYIANGPTTGPELYSTDGTTAGTNLVKDLVPGSSGTANNLAVSNGKLFYQSSNSNLGYEPIISDGTGNGTALLKDINPNGSSSSPTSFTQGPNGLTFFTADDGTTSTNPNSTSTGNGRELWVTDGTTANTRKVKDVNTFSYLHPNGSYYNGDSGISNLTSCNGLMFFTAADSHYYASTNYMELWVTDGTTANTRMVKDINTTTTTTPYLLYSQTQGVTIAANSQVPYGSSPQSLTCVNGTLFFSADDGAGRMLWKSDGTSTNTVKVRGISDGSYASNPSNFVSFNNKLIFSASAPSYGSPASNYGTELWISDGTTAGTVMLKDIYANSASSSPYNLTVYNGQVYFVATDYRGAELWKTDGTTVGTLLVKDINLTASGASSVPNYFYVWNNKLYFTADNGLIGRELYVTQGTGVTTNLVKDIFPGISDILDVSNYSGNQPYFAGTTSALIFAANSPIYGQEMWKTDGTESGTTLLQDLNALPGYANAHDGVAFNGKIYFSAASAYFGQELWSTDLTSGNTEMVIDIFPGASSGMDSANSYFTIFNGRLYFSARNAITGWELWSTDGTAAGTSVAADMVAGYGQSASSYGPNYITACNGKLFYAEYTGFYGLVAFDGTTGTNVYNNHLFPTNLACLNNTLFFNAQNYAAASYDNELWKSNGTQAGTSLFFDAYPGIQSGTSGYSGNPTNLTVYNNKLYFTANNGTNGTELYSTDGIATPTLMDILPGASSSSPSWLRIFRGELWFRANNGTNGNDFMSYDGTTLTARDIVAGASGPAMDTNLVVSGNLLWFRASLGTTGYELNSSDGTAANSGVFEDLSPNAATTQIANLTAIGGVLMYNTYDTVMGSQPRFVVVSAITNVTFNGNGSTSGAAPADIAVMSVSATIPGNTGALVKTNFDFVGWNTNALGTGTKYLPGSTISPIVDTPLYAMWSSQTSYTITYNANGATSGVVAPAVTGVTSMINLDNNSGAMTKTGYSFGGWNTNAGGTGTNYSGGARYTATANVTLYAKWTALTPYTITYNLNGASGTVPSALNTYATATVSLSGQGSMVAPTNTTFAGWNTNASGTGVAYAAAETIVPQASITLYAQWSNVAQSTLTYNANGATSGSVPTALVASGTYVVIDSNTGGLFKTGFIFSGWNTAADGTGTTYQGTDNYMLSANITLYAKWVAASYAITFAGNSNTGGSVPSSITGVSISATLPTNSGNLVRAGYSFVGWNTLPSGLGTSYSTGATFSPIADTILYAQWTALPTYTITYNANGATSGGVPVAQSGVYSSVTLDNNSGNLAKSGSYFAGWNTAADGSGVTYAASSSFTPTANVTLYALWSNVATYTVSYNSNSSTSGTAPLPQTGIVTSATVSANTGSLARLGYRFDGWNTIAGGGGTAYAAGATISPVSDVTLYAQWVAVPTYTITYNGNGQTSGSVPSPLTSSDSSVALAANTGVLNKTNYTFNGWNTLANGTGTHYDTGAQFALSANTTLYAEWLGNIYTLTYNSNGSTSGSAPAATSGRGTLVAAQNTGALEKTAYTFSGWNTASDGTGTNIAVGGSYTPTANTTLFAKWVAIPTYTITFNANGATSGTVPAALSNVYLQQTVPGNTGNLDLAARIFGGWNTNAAGTGTNYAVASTFTPSANLTLYAIWNINYSITYDSNGATSGTVPATQTGLAGAATVAQNTGSLVRTGYNFSGWNTNAGGTGTSYAVGSSITSSSDVILFAKWILIPTFNVTYNGNGSTSGTVPAAQNGIVSATVASNTAGLTKSGYTFGGWNDLANGTGISYAEGATITPSQNTVLYAKWILIPTYTITYDDNGSTGGSPVMAASGISSSVTLDANSGALVRDGYVFDGWNTQANGLGTTYAAGASYTPTANVTLYVLWKPVAKNFSVSSVAKRQFNLSGGTQTVYGQNLSVVNYISLDGKKLSIISSTDNTLTFVITEHAVGWANLTMKSDSAVLNFLNFVEFVNGKTLVLSNFFTKGIANATDAQVAKLALTIMRAREYKVVQLAFGTSTSGSSVAAKPITLKDNVTLLKLAMRLMQLFPKTFDVNLRLTGNTKDLTLTFTNS